MKKICILLTLIFFITTTFSINIFSIDTAAFSIKVNNFSKEFFYEKNSNFKLSSANENFRLPDSRFQKIIKKYSSNGKKIIHIKNGYIPELTRKKYGPHGKFMENTRYLNLDSFEIKKITGAFINSKNKIADIENFVYNKISKKIIGIPLLPAVDILKNAAGDCTEHAVLAISLFRSLKIPSRAVVGIYLSNEFMGEKNVFVYHMWAEIYYRGRWHLVDATRPGKKNHNRYIAFSYHSLKTEMPLSFLRTISAIHNLKITYIK